MLSAECYALEGDALTTACNEGKARVQVKSKAARKAYPCVGGPLDGMLATTYDFEDKDGLYRHLAGEYIDYNAAGRARHRAPSMIYVHVSSLKPVGKAQDR